MTKGVLKRTLIVCLVAQNSLAEAYLRQVLSRQKQIQVLTLTQYTELPPTRRKDTVFVVDFVGLEVPLIDCIRQLRSHSVNPKFLVLDNEKSINEIVRLLIMGIHGYLSHGEVAHVLVRAVLFVAANQFWIPADALHQFLCEASSTLRKESHSLAITPREEEILELVRKRLTNKEIASLLEIRLSTVKYHVSNILSKMQAGSRRDLLNASSQSLRACWHP